MGIISCHSNQSSYPTGIKNTTFVGLGLKAGSGPDSAESTKKYRMGPGRIYGKLREITIFRYRDSVPLPVRMRNGRYISYFTHQLDYDKFIYLFF